MERRRHARQKANSIVCVKLSSDNGGILLNLGTGGLSFQAVANLNRDQNLNIQFKLPDSEEAIQLEGSVAWLGPTGKAAGICFTDLSEGKQQRISEWLAKQNGHTDATELRVATSANPSQIASEMPTLPPRESVPMATLQDPIADPEPNLSPVLPPQSSLEDALSDFETSRPNGGPGFRVFKSTSTLTPTIRPEEHSAASIQDPTSVLPDDSSLGTILPDSEAGRPNADPAFHIFNSASNPTPAIPPEEHSDASIEELIQLSQKMYPPIPQPSLPRPVETSEEFREKEGSARALPRLLSSIVAACKVGLLRMEQILSRPEVKRNRKRLIMGGLATYFAILSLIVMARYHRYHLKNIDSTAASEPNVSAPPRAVANSAPAVEIAPQPQRLMVASPTAPSDSLDPRAPISAPPKAAPQVTRDQWGDILKKIIFGVDDTAASSSAFEGVSVWTIPRSGYYYCADSPYFENLKPGSIMTQRDALQSGYRPKLGSPCH